MEQKTIFLRDTQVAKLINCSPQTLRNQRFLGKGIPYVKAGRAVRYEEEEVIKYMRDRKIIPRF